MTDGNSVVRVLLVDDDEDDFVMTRDLLSEIEGERFETDWIDSYDAGLEQIARREHDVYLLDYRLGERSGLELLREAIERGCSAPLILLTGQGDHQVDIEAMEAGAADYLVKGQIEAPLLERSIRYSISQCDKALADLREAEERFRSAFDNAPIGMALVNFPDGCFAQVNRSLCELTGYSEEELLGKSSRAITHPEDLEADELSMGQLLSGKVRTYQREKRYLHRDGYVVWALFNASLVRDSDGSPLYGIGQIQDISERKRFEAELRFLADHDALTGLFNRRRFEEELERQVALAARYGPDGALLLLDLDNFKAVNDSLGHSAGDKLIRSVADLLQERLRRTDVVARLGGDEFAIILPQASAGRARHVAETLLAALRDHGLVINGQAVRVTTSIGAAPFDGHATAEEVLVNADVAMYEAKQAGRNAYAVHAAAAHRPAVVDGALAWTERIQRALDGDGFVLHCQPIVELASDQIAHYELLLRIQGDDGELVSPDAFLPVAERFGLMQEIDRWVVRGAIAMIAEHRAAGRDLNLAVNVSDKSVGDGELVSLIERDVTESGIDPASLILEVTETAAIAHLVAAGPFIEGVGALGCRFALADFGAGFGSFYYLKHLPVDFVRIDSALIEKLPGTPPDQVMVAIVQVAHRLGIRTIANSVGSAETMRLLREHGVDYAQGLHVGAAQPAPEWWSSTRTSSVIDVSNPSSVQRRTSAA